MKQTTVAIGQWAEQHALTYLQQQGMRVVARNYRCREGEIDIVATHEDTLVFVEVRYRKDHTYGSNAESIDARKQRRIFLTAQHFLQQHPQWRDSLCRFDAVLLSPPQYAPNITWIQAAFAED